MIILSRILGYALAMSLVLASSLSAQSADKVKSDVLSALATPLPITIVGPMLAQDVDVAQEGERFRATLKGASLMGFFPLGEVSMVLTPLEGAQYRVSDMRFPTTLDFPGIATLTHSGMELSGVWSAQSRSYSDLKWVIGDLKLTPAGQPNGTVSLGELSFDVAKAAEGAGTESRFVIGAQDVAVRGLGREDISLGGVEARLLANGEEPVDLYSVIREIAVRSTMRDGGAGLQTLAASLLGKAYETVSLKLAASDLAVEAAGANAERYLHAKTAALSASLVGIEPRNWEAADVTLTLSGLRQHNTKANGDISIDEAAVSLRAGDLPVADMFNTYKLLESGAQGRPVMAQELLAGLMSFGKIEVVTKGAALNTATLKLVYPADSSKPYEMKPHFDVAYESWDGQIGLSGFNRNEGKITLKAALGGGEFIPREQFPDEARPDIEAWFPKTLKIESRIGSLNEAFLKQVLKDVSIHDLGEPVELIAPTLLYLSATVMELSTGEDVYETALFRLTQSAEAKAYPTEVLNLVPYEGSATIRLEGFAPIMAYFAELPERAVMNEGEASMLRSSLTVARNIGQAAGEDSYEWQITRPDVTRTEIDVNGITFRYPDITAMLPLVFSYVFGRF